MTRTGLSIALCLALLTASAATAHDMFLVLPEHFVPTDSTVTVALYNGTFEKSENAIERDRMIDVSAVDGDGWAWHPPTDQWRDENEAALLELDTGGPGTYLVGVSTRPRLIELSAEDFNDYLEHDGVLDVLERRRTDGTLDSPAVERYSKHVKTILQVGDKPTETFAHRFGYPIEIVPLANPATLAPGDTLELFVLADGKPVAGQLVYASYAGFSGHGEAGEHREAQQTRTDRDGIATIEISEAGRWYVRLIRMLEAPDEDVDYESNWATLTFEVR